MASRTPLAIAALPIDLIPDFIPVAGAVETTRSSSPSSFGRCFDGPEPVLSESTGPARNNRSSWCFGLPGMDDDRLAGTLRSIRASG